MKKNNLIAIALLLLTTVFQVNATNSLIHVSSKETKTTVTSSNHNALNLNFHFGDIGYFDVKTPKGIFTELHMSGAYGTTRIGEPLLPAQKKLIAIPMGAEVEVTVTSYTETTINLSNKGIKNKLMPLQYDASKSTAPADIPFQYNSDAYSLNRFNQNQIAKVEILGVMRGIRLARITVEPLRYNPTTNQIIVYNDIEVALTFKNADWQTTDNIFKSTYSPFYNSAYSSILNIENVYDDHPDLLTFPVNMLIVADPMFTEALQPFLEWKTMMGYTLTVAYTDEIGSSVSEIQTWIQNEYNNGVAAGNAPDFLILVGDVQQVPASATGSSSGVKTDLYYGSVDGDMFPEMYYGRLSAQTVSQLTAQLDKILYYEKYEFDNPAYLDDVTLIAGADASGNPNYGQPTINYGTENYFNFEHGYNNLNVYLDSYSGCYDNERISVGFINYTAHCGQTSWADPNLDISDVNAFTNINEYPISIGNCCTSADFGYDECIGEAWVRAENKGSVGYIGSSPSSLWKGDMYWAVGAYPMTNNNGNGYVPTAEETTMGAYDGAWGDSYYCLDGLVFVGNLAVTEVDLQGWLTDSEPLYYWQAYNTLGDPSLMPYNTQGSINNVTHMDIFPIGVTEYEVTAEPGSYVAISKDGVLYGTGYADENGVATVQLTPITESGDVYIVVTKSQFIPYITTVPAAALEGPYLTVDSFVFDNDTTFVDYNTSANMTISIKNLGTDPANDVSVTITFTDDYCTLTTPATISVGTIQANEIITVENAYTFDILDGAPDMHNVAVDVEIEGTAKEIWNSNIDFKIHAPSPAFGSYFISDETGNGNGRIDPGETFNITIQAINNGNAASVAGDVSVITTTNFITINTPTISVDGIDADSMQQITFNATADINTPIGTLADFNLNYTTGAYSVSDVVLETIGLIVEDFETGNFENYDWQFNNFPWHIVDNEVYEGNYSAKSAEIVDNQSSVMEMNYSSVADGDISFFYKVSSEENYDFLKFFINGVEQDTWSGEIDWTEKTYAIPAGDYVFKWEYSKDISISSGDDCAWIDYILLPPKLVTSVYAGPDAEICDGNQHQCAGTATNYDTIFWHTSGNGTFDDINILNPVYTPGDEDISLGNVSLSLNLIDVDELPASDTMVLSFAHKPTEAITPAGPEQVNLFDTLQSNYTTDEVSYADSYNWNLYPVDAGSISGNEIVSIVLWNEAFEGDAWIKVAAQNMCGVGPITDSLHVNIIYFDAIDDNESSIKSTIIPNPTNGKFIFNLSSINSSEVTISITNQYGAVILSDKYIVDNGNVTANIDLSNQSAGTYFIITKSKKNTTVSKLLLIK